jgi:predicted RNA methylase
MLQEDEHWGYVDYVGKTVLDLGADKGSTTVYFLNNGAKRVIAVEGNPELYAELEKMFVGNPRVIYYPIKISSGEDIEKLLAHKPDVVKMDIEGDERYLLENVAVTKCSEWLIEVHDHIIYRTLRDLFRKLGYQVDTEYECILGQYPRTSFPKVIVCRR